MTTKPFAAYEGDQPYFFVSYAHEDGPLAYAEMAWIHAAGFNLWYDDGIHVGSVWRRALADALTGSSGLIFLATSHSIASEHCLKEISFALDEKKAVLVVQLDSAGLPPELRLALNDRQALVRSRYDEATYRARLVAALKSVIAPDAQAPEGRPRGAEPRLAFPRVTRLPSIALAPFANLSSEEGLTLWAEGVTDDIASMLSQRYLRVVDRGSQDHEMREHSDARYALSGNVRAGSGRLRLNTRFKSIDGDSQLWAERYDLEADAAFEQHDELVSSIVGAVAEATIEAEVRRARNARPEELDAWSLIMRANVLHMRDRQSRDEIYALCRKAVEVDPEFALAHGELAATLTHAYCSMFSIDRDRERMEAIAHADRALTLAPREPAVLACCSFAHRILGSEALAMELAERAVQISGSAAGLYGPRGLPSGLYPALILNGRPEEVLERAVKEAPPRYRALA
ncbi:MAG: TIR domain-containing protein, partial [Gammaproteobacteria bacterium]